MKKLFLLLLTVSVTGVFSLWGSEKSVCYEFADAALLKKRWVRKGKLLGVPMSRFYVKDNAEARDNKVLVVECDKSSGIIVTRISDSVWKKYPVMRWRWRILKKAEFKKNELDDQPAVLYFGDGTMLKQYQMGYRWEYFPAVGNSGLISYGMGATMVFRMCMRNKNAVSGKWYVEERNVVEDFKKAFKRLPEGNCALTIGANSQYSKSHTIVEIDYIEFRKAAEQSIVLAAGRNINTAERKMER